MPITNLNKNEFVYKLKVRAIGNINDAILVNGIKLGPGKIDSTLYFGDWYQNEYIVNCNPGITNSEDFKLSIKFYY